MVKIGEDKDVILFVRENLLNNIVDKNGNPVNIRATFPLSLAQVPCVVLILRGIRSRFLTVGATRQRWYATFEIQVWARDLEDRYTISKSIRERIWSIAKENLADNYVFMQTTRDTINDEVTLSGTPIYRATEEIEVIYDKT